MNDSLGLALSGTDAASLAAYEAAFAQFRCMRGDPPAALARALQARPDMVMAHVLEAWLNLLGTEPAGIGAAREACARAAALPATPRERQHVQAAALLAAGHWRAAGRALEDLSLAWPRDLLALMAGHQVDFFTGDTRMLRDRIARALPAWDAQMPGCHAVLSMHAFGQEECGDHAQALRDGRRSVELEPGDGWGWHAVAHVHEMRNEPAAGIAWLEPNAAHWGEGSFLAVHTWWHLALFRLEQDGEDAALAVYDRAIAGDSPLMLDLVDASAMLWRLHLRGLDLGARWDDLARRWQAAGRAGLYAFNDLHMMMAYAGAGWRQAQRDVLAAQQEALARADDNAGFTAAVGHAACRAVQAFGEGRWDACTALLRDIRSGAHRFGGSHAQRDVIDLTLLRAAELGGQRTLAAGLAIERAARRPRWRTGQGVPSAADCASGTAARAQAAVSAAAPG